MTQRQLELRVGGYVKYPVPSGGPLIQPIKWCNLGLEGILCVVHKTSSSRHNFSEGALTTTLLLYNVKVKVYQSCPTLCDPVDSKSMEFSRPEYWSGQPFPSPGYLPNPGIEPRSPTVQVDSLPSEPQGKPKNTGLGNLSLLQWIFLTQESKWGLQQCRWILYQLSYQGSLPLDNTVSYLK